MSCRVIVLFVLLSFSVFSFFFTFPFIEVCGKVGKQHLDAQHSTSQEACLSVCSTRVTAGDLRGDQGGLRLQALRP